MLRKWLRKLCWWFIQITNPPSVPYVVFTHTECGSQSIIPLGKYFPGWEEPAFECLGCSCITNRNIKAMLVDPVTDDIPENGSVAAFPIY